MQMLQAAFPILMMFGIFYFIILRPQARKQKEFQAMLSKLGKGDEVITRGGIIGKITGVSDDGLVSLLYECEPPKHPRIVKLPSRHSGAPMAYHKWRVWNEMVPNSFFCGLRPFRRGLPRSERAQRGCPGASVRDGARLQRISA